MPISGGVRKKDVPKKAVRKKRERLFSVFSRTYLPHSPGREEPLVVNYAFAESLRELPAPRSRLGRGVIWYYLHRPPAFRNPYGLPHSPAPGFV